MAIRKLLLPLMGSRAGEAALAAALGIGRSFGARVVALHVRVDSRDVAPLAGEGLSGAMIEDMMTTTERESSARDQAIHALFQRAVAQHGAGVEAAFLSMTGREEEVVARQARLADLTVVPHPESEDDLSSSDALHAVLFDSGRPALIAPQTAPARIGTRICVAWNGTAESASAVWAALPWLERAETVCILSAEEYQRSGPPASDLVDYLALHGVAAEMRAFRPIDRDVGAGLLAVTREWGADLLTMGAYSHSRLRQLILGGVTRHVLEHADLPVLMSR